MESKTTRWIGIARWTARLWTLAVALFALGEIIFSRGEKGAAVPWTDWLVLSLLGISIIGLILAWIWERLGGWLSIGALVVFAVIFLITVGHPFPAIIIFLLGIGIPASLFLFCASTDR